MSPEEEKKAIEEWNLEERKSRLSRVLCVLMAVCHRDDRLPELLRLNPTVVLGPNCLIVTIKDYNARLEQEVFVNVTDSGTFFVSHVEHGENTIYPHLFTLKRLAPRRGAFLEDKGLIKYEHDENVELDHQVKCVQYFLMWTKAIAMAPHSIGSNPVDYFGDLKEWLATKRAEVWKKVEKHTCAQWWEPISLEGRDYVFIIAIWYVIVTLLMLKAPDEVPLMVMEALTAIALIVCELIYWLRAKKDVKMVYSLHAFLRDNILEKAVKGKKE